MAKCPLCGDDACTDPCPAFDADRAEWQEPLASDDAKPRWGLAPPPTAVAAWGARAIYSQNRDAYRHNLTKAGKPRKRGRVPWYTIDLVWDRQDGTGDAATLAALQTWLNTVALPKLRLECRLDGGRRERFAITEGDFTLTADPCASFGYLYLGAWCTKPATK